MNRLEPGGYFLNRHHFHTPVAIAWCLLTALPALSATTTYTDRAEWLSNAVPTNSTDFNSLAPNPANYVSNNSSAGLLIDGIQFVGVWSASAYDLTVINGTGVYPWYDWGSGAIMKSDDHVSGFERLLRIYLPNGGATAFGVDLLGRTGFATGVNYTIRLDGATLQRQTVAHPNRSFFGFTSDAPIAIVEVLAPVGAYAAIDNVVAGTANVTTPPVEPPINTPETSTMLLTATGLVLVTQFWRRKK